MQANDIKSLSAILGPVDRQFGDAVADPADLKAFLASYQEKNRLERAEDTKAILYTGNND